MLAKGMIAIRLHLPEVFDWLPPSKRNHYLVECHRELDAPYRLLRNPDQRIIHLVPYLGVDLLRDADSALLREIHDPGGDVDSVPEDVAIPMDHISHVNPYPDKNPLIPPGRPVMLAEGGLDLAGAVNGLESAFELDEESVTDCLYLATLVVLEDGPNQRVVLFEELERERFISLG